MSSIGLKGHNSVGYLYYMLWSIGDILSTFTLSSCQHIYRENNVKADVASKAGLQLALGQWLIREHRGDLIHEFYHRPFIYWARVHNFLAFCYILILLYLVCLRFLSTPYLTEWDALRILQSSDFLVYITTLPLSIGWRMCYSIIGFLLATILLMFFWRGLVWTFECLFVKVL